MLLAIDTSTRLATVALYSEDGIRGEHTWRGEQNHTEDLMPCVAQLMAGAGVTPASLTGVVVAIGPGSFSGLRVGLSAAKGIAIALHIPLIGVCTLDALAYQHGSLQLPVRPILEAGRDQMATALYRAVRQQWAQQEEPHLATIEEICQATIRRTLFCGDIGPLAVMEFRRRLQHLAVIAPPAATARRGGYLAELGWHRLRAGLVDDPATLQPLYLRKPQITEPRTKPLAATAGA